MLVNLEQMDSEKLPFDLYGSFDKNLILKISKSDDKHVKIKNFIKKTGVDSVISADIICGVITINIARSLGLNIPRQLSVVGFGDKTISDYSTPRLSVIEQNGNQIGSRSVDLLVDRMNSKWFGLEQKFKCIFNRNNPHKFNYWRIKR